MDRAQTRASADQKTLFQSSAALHYCGADVRVYPCTSSTLLTIVAQTIFQFKMHDGPIREGQQSDQGLDIPGTKLIICTGTRGGQGDFRCVAAL